MTHSPSEPWIAAPSGRAADRVGLDERIRTLVDAIPHLAWTARSDGVIDYFNARVAAYATVPAADRLASWTALIHEDDLPGTVAAWTEAAAAGRPYEYAHRMRMADGTYRWHLCRAVPVADAAGGGVRWYGTATDVHELREAQEALRRTQASLGLAMRGGRMGWWARDLVTNAVTWSPELEEIFGLAPGAFGGSEDAFRELVHPDDLGTLARAVAAAVEEGRDYLVEFRYRHADGSWRWMEGRGRPGGPDAGPSDYLFGLGIDITDRKRADELKDLFVGMLSHELRTPVTAIFGGAQMLRRPDLSAAAREEITADVVAESERLERLVENLLVVARAERNAELGGGDPVLLRPLVATVVDGERRARPDTAIVVRSAPGLPPARGEDAAIELCLRNLVSNALKYGPREGPVEVELRRDGEAVQIVVADRGPGIADGDEERLFGLFYRAPQTRSAAPGAGIGLYVVRALVDAMGGRVRVANRPDGGAVFSVTLPAFHESDPLF